MTSRIFGRCCASPWSRRGIRSLNGKTGRRRSQTFDLVVLDIMMSKLDGIEACRRIRAFSGVPILFVSARDEELDRIIGLEVGGDDYITKPFSAREVVARVKAMLRRVEMSRTSASGTETAKRHGQLMLDPERFEVEWVGNKIVLTDRVWGSRNASAPPR